MNPFYVLFGFASVVVGQFIGFSLYKYLHRNDSLDPAVRKHMKDRYGE